MKNTFGNNLARLRKEKNMTQDDLAARLNVSFQAVSKWERGQTYPDLELLTELTDILETNIDSILGHVPGDAKKALYYQDVYDLNEFYWGQDPDSLCYDMLKLYPPYGRVKVLEIGCGEGKDAVFLARNGYEVVAFDIAQSGIDKLQNAARNMHLNIRAFRADMLEYRLDEDFDIIYSSRSLQFIKPEMRKKLIDHYKEHTRNNGIHVMNAFVQKPFIPIPPDEDDFAYLWNSGELFGYYWDWRFEDVSETIYDCTSSGVYHQHVMDIMIARKPSGEGNKNSKEIKLEKPDK